MSRNLFYSFFLIIGLNAITFGKAVDPKEIDRREILFVGENRQEYFSLYKSSLHYTVYGPDTVKIYARKAIPSRDNEIKSFGYSLIIDKEDTLHTQFNKRIYSKITSAEHRRHGYSSAGIYSLPIPFGKHELELIPLSESSRPVLVRMIINPLRRDRGRGKFILPESETPLFFINFGEKKIRYLQLDYWSQLKFSVEKSKRIKVICRLKYFEDMSKTQNYRLRLSKNGEVINTFFIQTEQSSEKLLLDNSSLDIGVSNSINIELDPGNYTFELLENKRSVYLRVMEYDF
ncbi:MAG: hypothetical protein QF453_00425 [Candidatus Marinimicrobia bacterium]|jgi:hypothetical protein|nr:hypothetical protein [Candidatus Neomarinimicrobiota bacterium]